MNKIFFFLIFISYLYIIQSIENKTIVLTDKTFDNIVQNGNNDNWFVMFYAPWCGHCKRLHPIWEEIANNLSDTTKFGSVDCDINSELKDRFSIMGYPTLLFFTKNKMIEYKKDRSPSNLEQFVKIDYLELESEEIPKEADKWKNIMKHLNNFIKKCEYLLYNQPYHVALFFIVVLFGAVITFYLLDFIIGKFEEKDDKKIKLN